MSILKNFFNPWEADRGVLESDVLGTAVLEGNVLRENTETSSYSQLIIPTAYIFADNELTNAEVSKVKEEVNLIFKKNGFRLDTRITSKAKILEKQKAGFGKYELAIGLVDHYGDSIGNSGFFENDNKLNDNGTKYLVYLTNKLLIYDEKGAMKSWVAYQNARKEGNGNEIHHYRVAFYVAHEFLHQMIIKAFCQRFCSNNPKNRNNYIEMDILAEEFEVHANDELNLNLDAQLFSIEKFNISVPNERPLSSKPFKLEKILLKHNELLQFWLNPKLTGPFVFSKYDYME